MNTVHLSCEGVRPPLAQALRLLDSLSHPLTPSLIQHLDAHGDASHEELLIQLSCDGDLLLDLLEDFSLAGIVQQTESLLGGTWQLIPNRLQHILRQVKKL